VWKKWRSMAKRLKITMVQPFKSSVQSVGRAWYAVRVRNRSEHAISGVLTEKDFECCLPGWEEERRYSDRKIRTFMAAFPGYLFCKFDSTSRVRVLNTPGVLAILGVGRTPRPVEAEVIFALQRAFLEAKRVTPAAYLKSGERIQIVNGPMAGAQGLLVRAKGQHRLIISVELLQRSLSVEVDARSVVSLSQMAGRHGAGFPQHARVN